MAFRRQPGSWDRHDRMFRWNDPKNDQNQLRWEVLDLWRQHLRSFHYIPHSPLNLIISCCALSGSTCGRITELDWIGQWSHCKCITLTLPILLCCLYTKSQYYCRRTTWCQCMHVKWFKRLKALYHWSNQSYVKYTYECEHVLIKNVLSNGCSYPFSIKVCQRERAGDKRTYKRYNLTALLFMCKKDRL